ncbi:MAG: PTS lactose/cellobiose transporter subunit IIA [Erysipelotrichaceae bacterium]
MSKEEVQSIAFMIIAYSGSAFDHFYKAIDYARENEFSKVENELELGKADLTSAHKSQAELLTAEVNQEEIPYSLIMTHAQDHLSMAIFSERMSKVMILMYKDRLLEKEMKN